MKAQLFKETWISQRKCCFNLQLIYIWLVFFCIEILYFCHLKKTIYYLCLRAAINLPSTDSQIIVCKFHDTFQAIFHFCINCLCQCHINNYTLKCFSSATHEKCTIFLNMWWLQIFRFVGFVRLEALQQEQNMFYMVVFSLSVPNCHFRV